MQTRITLSSLNCENCAAPISIPSNVKYVTCAHCGTHLKVHHTADADWTEKFDALVSRADAASMRFDDEIKNWKVDRYAAPIVGGLVGLVLALLGMSLAHFFEGKSESPSRMIASLICIVVSILSMASLGWLVIRILEYNTLKAYRWLADQRAYRTRGR